MEVGAEVAGMPIDKDMVLVIKIHETLVGELGARPITLKYVVDSQRANGVGGHYEAEYEFKSGPNLKFMCKLVRRDLIFRVMLGPRQLNYAIDLNKLIDDNLMPISYLDIRELVEQWLKI
jgi:hypothetical protein